MLNSYVIPYKELEQLHVSYIWGSGTSLPRLPMDACICSLNFFYFTFIYEQESMPLVYAICVGQRRTFNALELTLQVAVNCLT